MRAVTVFLMVLLCGLLSCGKEADEKTAVTPVVPASEQAVAEPIDEAVATEPDVSDAEIAELVGRLGDEDSHEEASGELVAIGKPAVSALIECMTHESVCVRTMAAHSLGEIGDPSAVPALMECLSDEDGEALISAVVALGKIGDPSALPKLEALFIQELGSSVGRRTATAIAAIRAAQSED